MGIAFRQTIANRDARRALATRAILPQTGAMDDDAIFAALFAAERRALALLDAIESAGLIAPGRTELEIERDIFAIAARDFGVTDHWHDRVVRAGANTLCVAGEAAPDRTIGADDIVFLDLGPVFGAWEADVGRSYAVGDDPLKHALCADLPVVFDAVRARFEADIGMTGAALYAIAQEESARIIAPPPDRLIRSTTCSSRLWRTAACSSDRRWRSSPR